MRESSYFMSPEKMVSRQCLACAGDAESAQDFLSLLQSDALPDSPTSAGSSYSRGCYHVARPMWATRRMLRPGCGSYRMNLVSTLSLPCASLMGRYAGTAGPDTDQPPHVWQLTTDIATSILVAVPQTRGWEGARRRAKTSICV